MKTPLTLMLMLGLAVAGAPGEEQVDPLKKLKLPGIQIHAEGGFIDVESEVCLDGGALELVACTKDSKEHESLIAVLAEPVHIHMALLLIGAEPGNPATQKQVGEGENKRWMFLPARGQKVHVSLVIAEDGGKPVERPIANFIQRIEDEIEIIENQNGRGKQDRSFPTSEFLFVGSHLIERGDGPRRYLAAESGNVISISTFGDEMLGLSEMFEHANGSLVWEINTDLLPKLGTKVTLRLKPVK